MDIQKPPIGPVQLGQSEDRANRLRCCDVRFESAVTCSLSTDASKELSMNPEKLSENRIDLKILAEIEDAFKSIDAVLHVFE